MCFGSQPKPHKAGGAHIDYKEGHKQHTHHILNPKNINTVLAACATYFIRQALHFKPVNSPPISIRLFFHKETTSVVHSFLECYRDHIYTSSTHPHTLHASSYPPRILTPSTHPHALHASARPTSPQCNSCTSWLKTFPVNLVNLVKSTGATHSHTPHQAMGIGTSRGCCWPNTCGCNMRFISD
jgi:hypothetical protein